MQMMSAIKLPQSEPVRSEQSAVMLVAEATLRENTIGSPPDVVEATVTHDGVAENIPETIVIAHAPAEMFPTDETHAPLWLVIDAEPEHEILTRSSLSTPFEFDVTEFLTSGAGCA